MLDNTVAVIHTLSIAESDSFNFIVSIYSRLCWAALNVVATIFLFLFTDFLKKLKYIM